MLTIRHIHASGHEEIHLTNRVSSQPHNELINSERTVFWERADGSTVPITDGEVYVMNDIGKTVAKYLLTETEAMAPPMVRRTAPPLPIGKTYEVSATGGGIGAGGYGAGGENA